MKTSGNFEIADSLLERKMQKEVKISNMRMKQKANEISKLQAVPTINKKSKRLVKNSPTLRVLTNKSKKNECHSEEDNISNDFFPDSPGVVKDILQNQPKTSKATDSSKFDNSEI